jgi:hypothetical protein
MTLPMQGLRQLTEKEIQQVSGGTITPETTKKNGGGNTPNGEANGVPEVTVFKNPAGHEPGGWN